MNTNYNNAMFEVMRKCPYARNGFNTSLVSACSGHYTTCKIENCPRKLM
jgi:hypothetical protein